jgi:hypothetical protein
MRGNKNKGTRSVCVCVCHHLLDLGVLPTEIYDLVIRREYPSSHIDMVICNLYFVIDYF